MKTILFLILLVPLLLPAQSLEKARRLAADGNHREAADLLKPLVLSPQTSAQAAADALRVLSESLAALDASEELHETADAAAKLHPNDHRVLLAASLHQSRIRSMQLLIAALPGSAKAPAQERVEVLWALYQALTANGEMGPEDFTKLTDITTSSEPAGGDPFFFYRQDDIYPTDDSGKPVLFTIPTSWDAAKNDGERIRWLLDQIAHLAPGNESVMGALWGESIHDSLRTLKIEASAELDCLPLFRAFLNAPKDDRVLPSVLNLDQLRGKAQGGIHEELLHRQQRPALVAELREWLKTASKDEAKWMREDIEMLTGAYGRFLGHPPQVAGQTANLEFIFRNATRATFTARKIDVAGILAESEKRLSSYREMEYIDPDKIPKDSIVHMRSIGTRLLLQGADQFLTKPVAEWRMDLQPAAKHEESTVKVKTPLRDGGAYWIEAALPGGHKAHCVLWIESLAIVATQVKDGMHYFLADAITGAPVAGEELRLFGFDEDYEKKRQLVRRISVKTARDGTATVPWSKLEDYTWLVSAQLADGRETHLGFDDMRGAPTDDPLDRGRVFIVTDRPVYRPGQKVSWHAWARRVGYDPKLNTNSYAGRDCHVTVSGPRGDKLSEQELTFDDNGALRGSITLADHAALGDYKVEIRFEGRRPLTETLRFKVEEYKKPEFAVKIESPAAPVLQGEDIEFTVRADYYFGGAVKGAKVQYSVSRENEDETWQPSTAWDWLYRSKESVYDYRGHDRDFGFRGEGRLDEHGLLKVRVPTSKGDHNHRYTFRAEVTDASRRLIAGVGNALAVKQPFDLRIDMDRGWYATGTTAQLTVSAHSAVGAAVKAQGSLSVFLGEKRITSFAVDLPTKSAFSLPLPQSGLYRLELALKDDKGREVKRTQSLTAHGDDAETPSSGFSGLQIEVEKNGYQPGEEVRMLVRTEKPGSSVVLFIHDMPVVLQLAQNTAEHRFTLRAADQPNVPWSAYSLRDGRKHEQGGNILVPPTQHIAKVELIPDSAMHGPRDTCRVRLVTRDATGKALPARVVLTGYDKSLEYISDGSNIGDIRAHFWGGQNSGVGSFQDTLRDLEARVFLDDDRHKERWLDAANEYQGWKHGLDFPSYAAGALAPAPAVSAGGSPDEAEIALMIRSRFADSAVWREDLATGADGTEEIEFPFPDNLTTWKLKAWVLGPQAQVGEAEVEVITRKDLLVRLQAPRFFIEKDEVLLSAIVHNDHATAQTVESTLELENGTLEPVEPLSPQKTAMPPHSEKRLEWRVRAKTAGEAKICVSSRSPASADGMEMTFPVRVRGAERVETQSISLSATENTRTLRFEVSAARRADSTRYELRYTPSLVPLILDALPPLIDYPHGCAEQTLNRFVPAVVAVDLLKRLNLNHTEYTPAKAAKLARTGLERLRDMRSEYGGWSWFPGARDASPHMTALIVRGLQLARYAGQSGTEELIEHGVEHLELHQMLSLRKLNSAKNDRDYKSAPDDTDALVHAALFPEKEADADMRTRLYENRAALSRQMVALLGLVCHQAKEVERRDMCLRNLKQHLQQDDATQTAWLKLPAENRWLWQNDAIETQATFLRLLIAANPADPLAPRVVKHLVQTRRHTTHWNSTRDTATVIHALSEYLRATQETTPELDLEFVLDGKTHSRAHLNASNLLAAGHMLALSDAELPTGQHTLEIRKTGTAPLFATAALALFIQEESLPAAGLDIQTQRRFFRLENDQRIEVTSDTPLRSGDLLEVELTLKSLHDAEYLLVEDFKPAGFETVSVRSGWNWDGVPCYQEFRDEKVCLYIERLRQGTHTLRYLVRAETPGRFTALPTQVSAMYAPEVRANSTDWRARVGD